MQQLPQGAAPPALGDAAMAAAKKAGNVAAAVEEEGDGAEEREERIAPDKAAAPLPRGGECCGGRTEFCRHEHSCMYNAARGFARGFWLGAAIKGGVALLSGLLFRRLYRHPLRLLQQTLSFDTARFALFWALFTGGFKGALCLLRRARRCDDALNAFAAGAVASLALAVDDPERRSAWALWMLARASDLLWRKGVAMGWLPDWEHGDLLAFSLLSCQVMYAWHLEPDCLPDSYRRWISARGGLDDRVVTGVRHVIEGRTPDMRSWCADNAIPDWHEERPSFIPCHVLHPLHAPSCTVHAIKRWFIGFWSGLSVYATVHLVPLLLFRARSLVKAPLSTLGKVGSAIFFSTSFITSFQFIFWSVFCSSRNLLQRDVRLTTVLAGLAAGLSVLWEKKSRRSELALFTLPRAIDCAWKILVKRGLARNVPHAELAIFAAAMGTILAFYQRDAAIIKPHYLGAMKRYFGAN